MKTSMKSLLVFLLVIPLFSKGQQVGQQPRDNFYDRVSPAEREVVPYQFVRESDVFWQKRIWRVINVDEKMNLPFKYFHKDWQDIKPLIDILLDALKSGEITGYDDDTWKTTVAYGDAIKRGGAGYDTIPIYDKTTGEPSGRDTVVFNEFDVTAIKKYRVKEDWYFDKQTATLQCRIVGIAPLYRDPTLGDIPLFWAYYPNLRKILVKQDVFNAKNDAVRMSWDDLFESRMFGSYIIKESNVFDRRIQDYKTGIDALEESEKIQNDIFNFEHDLWSF